MKKENSIPPLPVEAAALGMPIRANSELTPNPYFVH